MDPAPTIASRNGDGAQGRFSADVMRARAGRRRQAMAQNEIDAALAPSAIYRAHDLRYRTFGYGHPFRGSAPL